MCVFAQDHVNVYACTELNMSLQSQGPEPQAITWSKTRVTTSPQDWPLINPLSHYITESKLPSGYHEHICFVDHDMGKVFVFCKSSVFHDLERERQKVRKQDIP